MSTLIVLGYPSEAEAKSAYQKILDLDKNLIVACSPSQSWRGAPTASTTW